MGYRLVGTDSDLTFEVRAGARLVVGRAFTCDIPLIHPTVSRRHAEIHCYESGIYLRDMGSRNGTFVNGTRVLSAALKAGQEVTFGGVSFTLVEAHEPAVAEAAISPNESAARAEGAPVDVATVGGNGWPAEGATSAEPSGRVEPATGPITPNPTIVRQRAVDEPGDPLGDPRRTAELRGAAADESIAESGQAAKKLALLLEVSKALSRPIELEELLDKITGLVFQTLDVDRVAIALREEDGRVVPRISLDRSGTVATRAVPQSIARKVVDERIAVLTDNAPEDRRFGGESIVMQSVRSAMCAPLVGSDGAVHGVLYVDNLTTTHRFDDDDLDFLIAFAGIAAVAIENNRLADRIRRDAVVRNNFERYFAPALAARIADHPAGVRLGGEKRRVAVLFSDIRGFTALSEPMTPAEVAHLLSEYFTVMVDVVFRHGGTLDKFIGDAIMAQWGAPISTPHDADQAMAAALDMLRALDGLNERWRGDGRPALQVGIGLNIGDVFAGNIGAERRLEFTVIGDAVNVASRLCAAADGGEIVLTEEFRRALSNPPPVRERPPIDLKGKIQPLTLYSVVR